MATAPAGQQPPAQPPPVTALNDRGVLLVVLCFVFLALATVAVGLRLFARRYQRTRLSAPRNQRMALAADDYWILVALLFLYGNGVSEIVAVFVAARGHHLSELPVSQIEQNLQILLAAELSWTFCTTSIKISLLFLYTRLFTTVPNFRQLTWILLAVIVGFCLGSTIYFLANCRPFAANWDATVQRACGNQHAGWLGTGIANIVTDAIMLSLPMLIVYNLHLKARTKVAVMAIFGVGFLTFGISIARLVAVLNLDLADSTYSTVPADIFSLLEPCLMIIAACLPLMKPLLHRFMPRLLSRTGRSQSSADRHGAQCFNPKSARVTGGKLGRRVHSNETGTSGDFPYVADEERAKEDDELGLVTMNPQAVKIATSPAKSHNGPSDNELGATTSTAVTEEKSPVGVLFTGYCEQDSDADSAQSRSDSEPSKSTVNDFSRGPKLIPLGGPRASSGRDGSESALEHRSDQNSVSLGGIRVDCEWRVEMS